MAVGGGNEAPGDVASIGVAAQVLPLLTLMGVGGGGGGGGGFMMFIAIVLPIVLQQIIPIIRDFCDTMRSAWCVQPMRQIVHTRDPNVWWEDKGNEEAHNALLQRAILKYINDNIPDVAASWKSSDIQTRVEDRSAVVDAVDVVATNDRKSCGKQAASSYLHVSYICAPPDSMRVDLRNGITLERSLTFKLNESSRNNYLFVTRFCLRHSCHKEGSRKLNEFIDTCVEAYNAEQRKKTDHSRHMYTPVLSMSSADDKTKTATAGATMLYKMYKLADTRTFASFFHPEKDMVIALVDQFLNKRGKFAIPGYPLKLGFLLHGPPGTGKTSFIKALAQYTNRNIVNIPLSKIKTNQDLMNLMFDQSIRVACCEDESGAATRQLLHSKVIFVMEDVDAASSVVKRPGVRPIKRAATTTAAAIAAAASAIDDADKKNEHGHGEVDDEMEQVPVGPISWRSLLKGGDDRGDDVLNLSGLLNVLDGVVDTPERILVMTTNRPEVLDGALIRPGRINREVFLGNIKLDEARSMIRHYFNSGEAFEDPAVEARLADIFRDDLLSPAALEAMCAEHDAVDELITQLHAHFTSSG